MRLPGTRKACTELRQCGRILSIRGEVMDYPIQVAAKRTGLTASTLRAWERRYDGVKPDRDQAGRRRYPEELVEKLSLLSSLVQKGYRIGEIAPLSLADLRTRYGLVAEVPGEASSPAFSSPEAPATGPSSTEAAMSPKASVYIDAANRGGKGARRCGPATGPRRGNACVWPSRHRG